MELNNTKSNKTDGSQTEPVRVETCDNREIEAVHHVVNNRAQVLNLYINERAGGIDLRIPLSNIVLIVRSAAGARANDVSDDERLMTDGGDDVVNDGNDDNIAEDIEMTTEDIEESLEGVTVPGAVDAGDATHDRVSEDADASDDDDTDAPIVTSGSDADDISWEELHSKSYSDAEIADSVDVEDITIDNHVDKRFTTTPESGNVDMPEYDMESLKWLCGAIDGGKQITVHVRVLDVREYNDSNTQIIIADRTATTRIEIPDQMRPSDDSQPDPIDEFNAGDSILIDGAETVEVRTNDHYTTLRYSFDTNIEVCDEWSQPDVVPVGVTVDERSKLVNDADRYAWEDKHVARERMVDTILSEFDLLNPKDTDEVWMWVDETAWEPGAGDVVKGVLQDVLPSAVNTRTERNEIADQVKLATQTNDNPFTLGPPDDPDLKWCVPVENGLVDLREEPGQELIEHKPEHYTTRPELLDVAYDPDAECPGIEENLEKIATDERMKATIEEMMANVIMRNNDFRKTYIKEGDEQTGKSFIDSLMKWLVGDDGVQHMAFTKFVTDDFEADAARNSYAVIDDDASSNMITQEQCAAFKRFVGTGGVRTGAKNVQRESYDPYATIMMNVNNPPVWKGWDGSIKSRLMPLFFVNQFVADPDPDNPRQHQKMKESELERELRTDEEMSGLLNVVIEAANRLAENEEWTIYENYYDDMPTRDPEKAHDKLIRKYINYADTTRRFGRKFMTNVDDAVEMRKDDWHTIYRRYCDEEDIDPQSKSKFWEQLKNDDTIYVEEKNPYQSKRVTVHIAPTSVALDYAPAPVKDRIEGLVESSAFNVGVDETTPITDLPRSSDYVTVEGEVVTKTMDTHPRSGDSTQVLVIEDDSGGRVTVLKPDIMNIDTEDVPIMDSFDAVLPGDTVRVHSGIKLSGRPYMRLQDGSSAVDVVARDGLQGEQSGLYDGGDDAELPSTVEVVIDALDDGEGAAKADIMDRLTGQFGLDPRMAANKIESLKISRRAVDPGDGQLRLVSDGQQVYESLDTDRRGMQSQHDRVNTIKSVIGALNDGEGASEPSVIGELTGEHNLDPKAAEEQIESMKTSGKLEAPADGTLRVVNPEAGN